MGPNTLVFMLIHLSTLLEVLILVLKYNQPCNVVLVFILDLYKVFQSICNT